MHSHSDTLRPEWILSIFPQAETVCSKEVLPAVLIWTVTVCVNQVCVTIVLINSWKVHRLTINTQNSRLLLLGNISTTTRTTNWKSVMTTVLVLLVSSTQYIHYLWPFMRCASVTSTSLRYKNPLSLSLTVKSRIVQVNHIYNINRLNEHRQTTWWLWLDYYF